MAGDGKNRVGSFLTRKLAAQTVRQRHGNAPQFNGRVHFRFPKHYNRLSRRVPPMPPGQRPAHDELKWHRHLEGDVNTRPAKEWRDTDRADKMIASWAPRGRLSLHQLAGKTETFVCFRCGYPVKSRLVAVKDDNWDYRMCYTCYTNTVRNGLEDHT
uniref:Uncharacterized protein n=1 Tax=Neobodo designis TaxID=312471 RepID=A0A7S1QP36_NEODS|mmetsp:Transcript_49527/g.152846  ORF Transcript_49527/g.152846 Transcript_49527/m.152846 type:complete len:157 (+) Transcript_49527:31-501(+)